MKFCGLSAKLYDCTLNWLMLGKERKIRQEVAELLLENKKLKILDIGCGTGSQLIEIKKNKERVECHGIDNSKYMLKIARRKAKNKKLEIDFSYQNFSSLNFKKNYFDYVIAFLSLHEINYETREKAIQEIERVLKKNGCLILVDFKKTSGFVRVAQKLIFFIFEKHAENFLETKKKLLKNFKKEYSKDVLEVLSIEKHAKK